MMCPECGKILEGDIVRCPDCGTAFDAQYAPPQIEQGPTMIQQTRQSVIPKNVPVGKAKHSAGWIFGLCALGAIMAAAAILAVLVHFHIVQTF